MKHPLNTELISPIHHDEFLPPISRWMTLGGFCLSGTVTLGILICAITPLPVTIKADGVVRPNGEVKIIQANRIGKVKDIKVKENQSIKKGDSIILLEDEDLKSKKTLLKANIYQNQQQIKQIDSQLMDLQKQTLAEENRIQRTLALYQAELERTKHEYTEKQQITSTKIVEEQANLQATQKELQKQTANLATAKALTRGSELALKIAIERQNRYQKFADSGVLSQDRLEEAQLQVTQAEQTLKQNQMALEAQKTEIERQKNLVEASKARLELSLASQNPSDAMIKASNEKIAQEQAIGEVAILRLKQEIKGLKQRKIEIEKQINGYIQEIKQLDEELKLTEVISPVDGTILKLNLRNISQSVNISDEIARIMPNNNPLVIKAKVETQDRGKLQLNQVAQMRISAYPYPDYGLLSGKIVAISPDVIQPQLNSNQVEKPYYEVTIEPETFYLKNDPNNVILSGMELKADIIAQEETILKYILRKARLLVDK